MLFPVAGAVLGVTVMRNIDRDRFILTMIRSHMSGMMGDALILLRTCSLRLILVGVAL